MSHLEKAPFRQDILPEETTHNTFLFGDHAIRSRDVFRSRDNDSTQLRTEGLAAARDLYGEHTEEFDIRHAGFYPLVGTSDEGVREEYIVSKRIEGVHLKSDALVPGEQQSAVQTLLQRLTHYVTQKHDHMQPMLSDIYSLNQYMYDKAQDEMILFDVDPYISPEDGSSLSGPYLALRDMNPYAAQVLDEEAYVAWKAHLKDMIPPSELADQDF